VAFEKPSSFSRMMCDGIPRLIPEQSRYGCDIARTKSYTLRCAHWFHAERNFFDDPQEHRVRAAQAKSYRRLNRKRAITGCMLSTVNGWASLLHRQELLEAIKRCTK
jgi:hypothetical protein